jgi:transmembrane sensor
VLLGDRRRRKARARSKLGSLFRSPSMAVGLSTAALLSLLFYGLRPDGEPIQEGEMLVPVETASGSGDITTLGLSDGSVVRLAADSRVEFPPGAGERNVVLEGKAFFAVAAGETPFVIQTRLGEVTVRGTRFEVLTDEESLRVAVLEGLVEVEGAEDILQVGPGQVAYLPEEGRARVEAEADLRALLSWPGGLLIFQDTPFAQVAQEVGDHFGVPFSLSDREVGARRITAWFGDEPLDEVLGALGLIAGVQCTLQDGRVIVES